MRFAGVTLNASARYLRALADFYGRGLGIEVAIRGTKRLSFTIGETAIELLATEREPFYHFALLVPGDRFQAALDWARARVELLPDRESGKIVFGSDAWTSHACYFHDPVSNIVELIAHSGIGETGTHGAFSPAELLGISELGLVGNPAVMARQLHEELGLALWDGTVEEPGRLAFVGEQARTLILSPARRGWQPTGRRAEPHPVVATLAGSRRGAVELEGSCYRISSFGAT